MLQEKDKKFLGQAEAIYSFHKNGGVNKYGIPKTGKHRDTCYKCMGIAEGQILGYLYALKVHNLITDEEYKEQRATYNCRK